MGLGSALTRLACCWDRMVPRMPPARASGGGHSLFAAQRTFNTPPGFVFPPTAAMTGTLALVNAIAAACVSCIQDGTAAIAPLLVSSTTLLCGSVPCPSENIIAVINNEQLGLDSSLNFKMDQFSPQTSIFGSILSLVLGGRPRWHATSS
jgi:hypothetical protein